MNNFYTWIGVLVGLGGGVVGLYAVINPKAVAEVIDKIGPQSILFAMTALMVAGTLGILLHELKKYLEIAKKRKRLSRIGVKTSARIVDVHDTGVTVNTSPSVKITVEINGSRASFQTLVSRLEIPRVGDVMEVIYDPSDPSCVLPA